MKGIVAPRWEYLASHLTWCAGTQWHRVHQPRECAWAASAAKGTSLVATRCHSALQKVKGDVDNVFELRRNPRALRSVVGMRIQRSQSGFAVYFDLRSMAR